MRNIRDYVLDLQPTPILALCLHSYSQLWMYPYGYKTGAVPENVKEIVSFDSYARELELYFYCCRITILN